MLKNKKQSVVAAFLLLGLLSSVAHAQTISDLAEAAKQKQLGMGGPVANTSSDPQLAKPVLANQGNMILTGIFISKDATQVGISVGGVEIYAGPGDDIMQGWVLDSISGNSALLKRCKSPKHCETKKLIYTLTR